MLNLEMLNLEAVYHCRSHGRAQGFPIRCIIVDPLGAQGPPYGVSLSWFLFIHLVIILLLLPSFIFLITSGFSYHVLHLWPQNGRK